MSKHRAIAQRKMAEARAQVRQSMRMMRSGPAEFNDMHAEDARRHLNRFTAYFLASDAMPPLSTQGVVY
jgi:hypothetical protein